MKKTILQILGYTFIIFGGLFGGSYSFSIMRSNEIELWNRLVCVAMIAALYMGITFLSYRMITKWSK